MLGGAERGWEVRARVCVCVCVCTRARVRVCAKPVVRVTKRLNILDEIKTPCNTSIAHRAPRHLPEAKVWVEPLVEVMGGSAGLVRVFELALYNK